MEENGRIAATRRAHQCRILRESAPLDFLTTRGEFAAKQAGPREPCHGRQRGKARRQWLAFPPTPELRTGLDQFLAKFAPHGDAHSVHQNQQNAVFRPRRHHAFEHALHRYHSIAERIALHRISQLAAENQVLLVAAPRRALAQSCPASGRSFRFVAGGQRLARPVHPRTVLHIARHRFRPVLRPIGRSGQPASQARGHAGALGPGALARGPAS